ncbi:sugar ABC transporter ATP-binding protein [Jatrophihabitans sp.]|uniref:sugar ABC transporter ATP-binding protein n=1 Tax=Jatrophihabitans sp. TaxID=1932789 RepID=UPI0030C6F0CD|nr:Monosaccharide transporter ATP-binding protein family [Jatrophihabitans sp.]
MSTVAPSPTLLTLSNLSKNYPGQTALDGVALSIAAGEVHALLGANGSGKSTLIKILTGVVAPDPGALLTLGDVTEPLHHGASRGELRGMPVRCVHQDLGLVEALSVVDNVALSDGYHTRRSGTIDWREEAARAETLLRTFNLPDLDVFAPISAYPPLIKVQIAIARVMGSWGSEPGLLILDEPTAQLPDSAAEQLFGLVEQIRAAGTSVLFVTHRLAEVFRIADSVSILRQGRLVHRGRAADLDRADLIEHIVGERRALDVPATGNQRETGSEVALQLRGLTGPELRGADLTVRRGEIVGVVGVIGAGHAALAPTLMGLTPVESGTVEIGGVALPLAGLTPTKARAAGLAWVPPDRKRDGIIAGLPVGENITIGILSRFRVGRWLLNSNDAADEAVRWQELVDLQPRDPSRLIEMLSGGNQQKAVMARNLAGEPVVLLLSEPTAGVDIGAREQLYAIVAAAAEQGVAVVVTSTDYGDLAAICHRVLVFSNGQATAELHAPGLSEPEITHAVLSSEDVPSSHAFREVSP